MLKYKAILVICSLLLLTACGRAESEEWGFLDYAAVHCTATPDSPACGGDMERAQGINDPSRSRSR